MTIEEARRKLHEALRELEKAERLWQHYPDYIRRRRLEAARIKAQNARYALQMAETGIW